MSSKGNLKRLEERQSDIKERKERKAVRINTQARRSRTSSTHSQPPLPLLTEEELLAAPFLSLSLLTKGMYPLLSPALFGAC